MHDLAYRRFLQNAFQGYADDNELFKDIELVNERSAEPVMLGTEFGAFDNPTFNFQINLDGHVAFRSAFKTVLPIELPRLTLSLRAAYDRRHPESLALRQGKLTADSLRATVLMLKIIGESQRTQWSSAT